MAMRVHRSKLNCALTNKEFKVYWRDLCDWNWDECDLSKKGNPKENRAGKYRFRREMKSWKNYRRHQWR